MNQTRSSRVRRGRSVRAMSADEEVEGDDGRGGGGGLRVSGVS